MSLKSNFFLCLISMLCLCGEAFCQKYSASFSSGVIVSNIDANTPFLGAYELKAGWTFGGNLTYHLSKRIGIRTGLGYEKKGGGLNVHFTDANGTPTGTETAKLNFDYLILPVLVQLSFGEKIRFTLHLGQSLGYMLKATSKFPIPNPPSTEKHDETENFNRFDYSILAGCGVDIPLTRQLHLQTELRSFSGLSDIFKNNGSEPGRNLGFSATTGVRYLLK